MQENIATRIIEIGKEILQEHLFAEMGKSPVGEGGKKGLTVAGDARWDKRGSGRRYDSLSGCSVVVGLQTQLIVGIEPMSQVCVKCRRGIEHADNICPLNYDGSTKGMEAMGIA